MKKNSYLSIEEFGETVDPNKALSSAWLVGQSPKGAKYTVGVASSEPSHIVVSGERKENEEESGFKIGSSNILEVLAKLQERYGGKIEPSDYGIHYNFDLCSIYDTGIQTTPEKIIELAQFIRDELKFTDIKIKPILWS